jgi:hypothetical protein
MAALNQRTAGFPSVSELEAKYPVMAQRIRHLRSLQETEDRGAIAKHLGIKYQWVRNVLTQEVKNPKQPKAEEAKFEVNEAALAFQAGL